MTNRCEQVIVNFSRKKGNQEYSRRLEVTGMKFQDFSFKLIGTQQQ